MISKIIRIERTTEKPAYVKDNITKEIRHIADNEFKGEKITHYRIVLANYFEIGFFIFPLDGELDKIIPFWFWTEKEVIPSEYVESISNGGKCMEIENLAVTLKVVNGEYIVNEPKSEEKNLHIGHIENVLNYYGKKGWILKQINSNETELSFYRNKAHWFKKLIMGSTEILHRRRNIYEKGGKYEVGADTPFGETSSFEDLYLDSIQEVINHLKSKYGLTFICQSPGIKVGDETLIIMYFLKNRCR